MRKLFIKRERALACFALPYHCIAGRSIEEHLQMTARLDRAELMTSRTPGTVRSGETAVLSVDEGPTTLFVIAYREHGELTTEELSVPAGQEDLYYVVETRFNGDRRLSLHLHPAEAFPAASAESACSDGAVPAVRSAQRRLLAVFFPGIGYTVEKPLLYHSRRLASALDYDCLAVSYGEVTPGVWHNKEKLAECGRTALIRAKAALSEKDLSLYDDILFIGKSIGTVVAAKLASESPFRDRIRLVLFTPLEDTFACPIGRAVAFTGTNDPWTGGSGSRIPALCRDRQIPCHIVSGANHSLETDQPLRDIEKLRDIMLAAERFIRDLQ